GRSDALTLKFGEGDYVIMMEAEGALGLGQGQGIYVDHDKIYDYSSPSKFFVSTSGDITGYAGTMVLSISDQRVEPDKPVKVQGKFGVLTLNSDGTYTYSLDYPTPKPEGWTAPYGEMDQFQVVTQDKDGQTIVETIDIKIGTHTAEDDFNSIMIDSVNETSSVNWVLEKKVGDHGTSQEYKFTIANHDKDAPATLKVVTDSDGVITSKSVTLTYTLTNTTTGQVFTKTVEGVDVALEVT